jgi:transcriptional regulator with XRE-family HTH domain
MLYYKLIIYVTFENNMFILELSVIIGKELRRRRLLQNKSMKALAYESDMEYMQLSRIELGKINTTVFQLLKLCTALGIEISDLFNKIESDLRYKKIKQELK